MRESEGKREEKEKRKNERFGRDLIDGDEWRDQVNMLPECWFSKEIKVNISGYIKKW